MCNEDRAVEDQRWRHRFGRTVAARRREIGLTQENLAFETGLHRTYIGSLERGIRNPTLTTAARIARGLRLSLTELLARVEAEGAESGETNDQEPDRK